MPTRVPLGRNGYKVLEERLTQLLRARQGHEDAAPSRTEIEEAIDGLSDTRWMLVTLAFGLNGDRPLSTRELVKPMTAAYPTMHWSISNIYSMLNEATRKMVDYLANEQSAPTLYPLDEPSAAEVAADCMRRRLIQVEFWRLIRGLTPRQFDYLVRVYLEGRTFDEVAEQMDVTRSAVHATTMKARRSIATRAPHVTPRLLEAL